MPSRGGPQRNSGLSQLRCSLWQDATFGHPAACGRQEVQGVCAISFGALCIPRQACWLFFIPFSCLPPPLLRVKASDSCWLIIIREHWLTLTKTISIALWEFACSLNTKKKRKDSFWLKSLVVVGLQACCPLSYAQIDLHNSVTLV